MTQRRIRNLPTLIAIAAAAGAWAFATVPWGVNLYELLVFTAPGAVLALGASWMGHATTRSTWTWKRASRAALAGAILVPPILAFLIALHGSGGPQTLVIGFVYLAWAALIGGGLIGLLPRRKSTS